MDLDKSDYPTLEAVIQDYESGKEDEEFEEEDWVIQGHAVDTADGEAKFKVVYGKRENRSDKFLWGTYSTFVKDGLAGLDKKSARSIQCTRALSHTRQSYREKACDWLSPLLV